MKSPATTSENVCPRDEIGLYLDGELSSEAEIFLENHFAECEACLGELNLQKKMLSALNIAFEERRLIELPSDFTRVVVAKAESGVRGLRAKGEQTRAALICLCLFLVLTLGFSVENEKTYQTILSLSNQILALGEFLVHFVLNLSLGMAVILRNLSQKIVLNWIFAILLLFAFSSIFLLTIQRLVLPRRIKG